MRNKSFKGIILFLSFLLVFFCLMAVVLQAMGPSKSDTDSHNVHNSVTPTTGQMSSPSGENDSVLTEEANVESKVDGNVSQKQPTAAESRILLRHYAVGIITAIFLILAVVVAVISKRKDMTELSDNHY